MSDADTLKLILDNSPEVVVLFTAPSWCRPCQNFAPIYASMADQLPDVDFLTVDVDEHNWAVKDYEIQSVPTIKLFKDGELVTELEERTVNELRQEIINA